MRTGKITSSGPIKALNFLKKNVELINTDKRISKIIGKFLERDMVDILIARKACEKANNEGRIEGVQQSIDFLKSSLHDMDECVDGYILDEIVIYLNILKDRLLGESV